MAFVFLVMYLEYYYKVRHKYSFNQDLKVFIKRRKLSPFKAFLTFLYCLVIAVLGFILPFIWLLYWGLQDERIFEGTFYSIMLNSLVIAAVGAIIVTLLAYFLIFVARVCRQKFLSIFILKLSSLGYAIPGAAIGISIMIFVIFFGKITGVDMMGYSLVALVFAYVIRFLATSIYSLEAGYSKIHAQTDEVLLFMRPSLFILWSKIHTPLLKHFLLLSFIVVFIDIVKELPLARMLSPFGFETLALKAFWYASDERIYDAALPSLLIVLMSLFAIFWVQRFGRGDDVKN